MSADDADDDPQVEIGPHRTMRRSAAIAHGLWAPAVRATGRPRGMRGDAPEVAGATAAVTSSGPAGPPETGSSPPAADETRAAPEMARAPEVVGGFEGDCSATIHAEITLAGPGRLSNPAVDAQTPGKARPRRSAGQQTRLKERDGQREASPPEVASASPAATTNSAAPEMARAPEVGGESEQPGSVDPPRPPADRAARRRRPRETPCGAGGGGGAPDAPALASQPAEAASAPPPAARRKRSLAAILADCP